jgi:hypothetical protein
MPVAVMIAQLGDCDLLRRNLLDQLNDQRLARYKRQLRQFLVLLSALLHLFPSDFRIGQTI